MEYLQRNPGNLLEARKRNGGLSVGSRKPRVYISGKITETADFMERVVNVLEMKERERDEKTN